MHRIFSGRRSGRLVPAVVALAGAAVVFAPGLSALMAGTHDAQDNRTVYLSVTDQQGVPVTDLRADEVMIREGGQGMEPAIREVISVKKATEPMSIMLLADTSKATGGAGMSQRGSVSGSELVRDVRVAFSAFVKTMSAASPDTKMELMEFGQAAVTITGMTSNAQDLQNGINKLFPKNNMPAVLLEAITEAGKILAKTPTERRAIVALNVLPTDEQSRQAPNQMLQAVRSANASVWAVSYNSGTVAADPRGVVLDALATNTGGRRETIASQSALELHMTNVANALANQYEITFHRPKGGPQPEIIQFGLTRQGLRMMASIYAPK
jgi:hypothetical protein